MSCLSRFFSPAHGTQYIKANNANISNCDMAKARYAAIAPEKKDIHEVREKTSLKLN
jgi:hypothetical protein